MFSEPHSVSRLTAPKNGAHLFYLWSRIWNFGGEKSTIKRKRWPLFRGHWSIFHPSGSLREVYCLSEPSHRSNTSIILLSQHNSSKQIVRSFSGFHPSTQLHEQNANRCRLRTRWNETLSGAQCVGCSVIKMICYIVGKKNKNKTLPGNRVQKASLCRSLPDFHLRQDKCVCQQRQTAVTPWASLLRVVSLSLSFHSVFFPFPPSSLSVSICLCWQAVLHIIHQEDLVVVEEGPPQIHLQTPSCPPLHRNIFGILLSAPNSSPCVYVHKRDVPLSS